MAAAMPDPQPANDEPLFSTLLAQSPQLGDVVEDFVRILPIRMAAIENAMRAGAYDQVRAIAHDLGDRGTTCGYTALRDQSAQIEQAASDHVAAALTAKLDELRDLITRIQAGLQRDE